MANGSNPLVSFLREVGGAGLFAARTASRLPSALRYPRRVLEDLFEIGVGTMPTVLIVAVFVGTELSLQGYHAFHEFGAQNMVGVFVALAGVREMAPILVCGMIASKAGASITTNLAVMRNTSQLDAMDVMAVDPVGLLVAPKFIAAVIAIPALTAIADYIAMGSAYIVAVYQLDVEGAWFLENVQTFLAPRDLFIGLLKAMCMGIEIWILSCYFGYTAKPGPEGVGRAANTAIVVEVVLAVLIALVITAIFYGGQ